MANLISVIDNIVKNIGQKKWWVLFLNTHFSFLEFSNKFSSDYICKYNYICKLLLICWVIFRCTLLASKLSNICVQWYHQMWHTQNGECLWQELRWILKLFFLWTWCIICFRDFWVKILWGNQLIHSSQRTESELGLQLLSDKDCWCYHLSLSPE